jgi:OOP family OmpA-OmpF porin
MHRRLVLPLLVVLTGAVFLGCEAHVPEVVHPQFQPVDLDSKMKAGEYQPKADNLVVIIDASRSAGAVEGDSTDFERSKKFVYRMNQTIPEMTLNAALRSFGHWRIRTSEQTILHFGPQKWSRKDFQDAVDGVPWVKGGSPVDLAFDKSTEDMTSFSGHTAVILVGDGEYQGIDGAGAAKRMKARFGKNVCIYTVLASRETPEKVAIMKEIAAAGECGFYQHDANLESSQDMAEWIAAVLLEKSEVPPDSDGDGVIDSLDQCPDTPQGVTVDSQGCPLDTDGDGVYDYLDQCPKTPVGARVDVRGCWVIKGVNFNTGKSEIKPASYRHLDEVAVILANNPSLKVEIQGHTDNRGAADYNMMLSDQRANAVREYLVKHGISADRLSAVGYGLTRPAVSNDMAEGRSQNRRVELKPIK